MTSYLELLYIWTIICIILNLIAGTQKSIRFTNFWFNKALEIDCPLIGYLRSNGGIIGIGVSLILIYLHINTVIV